MSRNICSKCLIPPILMLDVHQGYYAICTKCGAHTTYCNSMEEASELWNKGDVQTSLVDISWSQVLNEDVPVTGIRSLLDDYYQEVETMSRAMSEPETRELPKTEAPPKKKAVPRKEKTLLQRLLG